MEFYNTLTRKKEPFTPIDPGHARLYTCGPTVYNRAHIGNFRAYVFEDVLRRALEFAGLRVTQVMNLTDVDDKTIRGARESGVSLKEYTAPFVDAFFEDLDFLNIERAEHYPAATDHIPEMIALIEKLFRRGLAYRSEDGSVYFSVGRFADYGRLARLKLDGMRPGARVQCDEYDKEGIGDFALWKARDSADGEVWWPSPWGEGRPGWHIECSAMSMKYLGESFDIHTGGIDNLFPHHENEIAQSEGATGKPFVHTWLHCAHLRVNGEKMAKSLGNFFTLDDLRRRGFHGREIRYVLLAGHYRQPLNFTFEALKSARVALRRLDEFLDALHELAGNPAAPPASEAPGWAVEPLEAFSRAVGDDLNIPECLAAVFALAHAGNRRLDAGTLSAAEAAAVLSQVIAPMNRVLGLFTPRPKTGDAPPPEIEPLLAQRSAARAARDWAESDRLRDELAARGWQVRDTPEGQKLKPVAP